MATASGTLTAPIFRNHGWYWEIPGRGSHGHVIGCPAFLQHVVRIPEERTAEGSDVQ